MKKADPLLMLDNQFKDGFARCAKVIVNIGKYDELIDFDKKKFEPIVKEIREKSFEKAVSLICDFISKRSLKIFDVNPEDNVIFFGRTANNLREISFFKKIMSFAPGFHIREINQFDKIDEKKSGDKILKWLKPAILHTIKTYQFDYFLTRQFLDYVSNFLSFYLSFGTEHSNLRMLVVANDHSPAQVAASVAAKAFRLKRVYLQHAAVTKNFPALDFEYAILNDKKSEELYREIGETMCETLVIQRAGTFDDEAWQYKLKAIASADSVSVVLYLSAVYNAAAVNNACVRIKQNSAIDFIGIKYHPATKEFMDGFPKVDKIPDCPHVAITGNSSVALELIRSGNMVYIAKVDDIPSDYYGFAREGLCKKIDNLDDLSSKFWLKDAAFFLEAEYGESIRERFYEDNDRKSLVLRKIYINSIRPKNTGEFDSKLLDQIILYPSTYFRLACKTKNFGVSDHELVKAYDSLFSKRILPFDACLKHLSFLHISSVTQFWFFTKKIEWNGFDPGEKGISVLSAYVTGLGEAERKLLAWAESKLFVIMLRYSEPKEFINFLRRSKTINYKHLNPNHKVALIRYMDRFPEQNFQDIYEEITRPDSLSGLALLKVAIQSNRYGLLPDIDIVTHYTVERKYLDLAHKDLMHEYEKYVYPFFYAKRKQAVYIDINHSPCQKNELVNEILNALLCKKPYSLVRLGDGEGYFFQKDQNPESIFSDEDAKNRERHWWGEEIPVELRSKIVDRGVQSILTADVIGIPTVFRFLRDTAPKTKSLMGSLQARGMFSVLQGVLKMNIESTKFTDSQLNVSLFSDLEVINKLAEAADCVVIVNGAKKENLTSFSKSLRNAICIEIPTHSKQKQNEKYVAGSRPLPFVFESVIEEMLRFVKPGTLVLVGGGVVGKAFVSAAKSAGGCAIDIGSAFDQLTGAGIHSLW